MTKRMVPSGPQAMHARRPRRQPQVSSTGSPMTPTQIHELKMSMKDLFGGKEPRDFQVQMVQAQEERRDALCQASTGSGKTAIAAGPYALKKNSDRVTLMVSPLIGLQDEMVETFRDEYKLPAIAINSAHGGLTPQVVQDICQGKYNIVLLSPEMMQSRRFINDVLRNSDFTRRVYSLVVDEAHCISHWGALFRKKYGSMGMIRVFLPRGTPIIAVSASITARLQFPPTYQYCNLGNDRANVSMVVRAIHNPLQSYTDLDFVVPSTVSSRDELQKTWIYADNIDTGAEIIDHLRERLPQDLWDAIRPYNAVHGHEYRRRAMAGFRSGEIRILVCTDAAGMGCNVPDIDVIVQWKLPEKLSSLVQRAGRAARNPTRTGLMVLLVEPAAYSVFIPTEADPPAPSTNPVKSSGKSREQHRCKPKKTLASEKGYARAHGRFRGARSLRDDIITPSPKPPLDKADATEGMYHFVQATTCRREILRDVFNNPSSSPVVPCCDICAPALLSRTLPGKKPPSTTSRTRLGYEDMPYEPIADALREWRSHVLIRDQHNPYLTAPCILPDDALNKLARIKIVNEASIKAFLEQQWYYWEVYGSEITSLVLAQLPSPSARLLSRAEPVPSTPSSSTAKRPLPPSEPEPSLDGSPSKRARTAARPSTLTLPPSALAQTLATSASRDPVNTGGPLRPPEASYQYSLPQIEPSRPTRPPSHPLPSPHPHQQTLQEPASSHASTPGNAGQAPARLVTPNVYPVYNPYAAPAPYPQTPTPASVPPHAVAHPGYYYTPAPAPLQYAWPTGFGGYAPAATYARATAGSVGSSCTPKSGVFYQATTPQQATYTTQSGTPSNGFNTPSRANNIPFPGPGSG
ncbi:P-loop containing nucleoside triphosphate hydrolase protein [Amylostereum chailletii]|nr:P-loop containing nucleoside triphosphate hydrolase protein [Amylostereum chailletii]